MAWVATAVVGSALIGGYTASKSAKDANKANQQMQDKSIEAQKEATKIDPRIEAMLYGQGTTERRLKPGAIAREETIDGVTRRVYSDDDYENVTTSKGLLDRGMDYLNQPQSKAMQSVGQSAESSLINNYANDQTSARNAINKLMTGQNAPQMQAAKVSMQDLGGQMTPAKMEAAKINAPEQNSIGLSKGYNDLIYGEAGNNPYLTGAIQKGLNQAQNTYGNLVEDQTQAVQDALASIRGGAVSSGQYGGSRQGLAESRTLSDMSKNLSRAGSQIGQNAQDAAVSAQSGAYDADRNRMLSAMGNLGSQQYGVASQDTAAENAARGMNANFQQQANQFNTNWLNQAGFKNADYQQQTNQANLGAHMDTDQANTAWLLGGLSALGGMNANAYNIANQYQNADFNKVKEVSGLLQPYAGKGSPINVPQYQPISSNPLGGAIGGATAAMGLYNMFKSTSTPTTPTANNSRFDFTM